MGKRGKSFQDVEKEVVTRLIALLDGHPEVRTRGGGGGEDEDPPGGLTAVPEPGAWAMMLTGFGLVGAMLRRPRTVRANA